MAEWRRPGRRARKTLLFGPFLHREPSAILRLNTTKFETIMNAFFKSILQAQFGAVIDMLENVMRACPDTLWTGSRFWHISYHTLFYLDLSLSDPAEAFAPPAPFTLSELDPSGVFPGRAYTK